MGGVGGLVGTLPDEEEEEVPAGGILDPIKQKGLVQGGLELAGMMVPGAFAGVLAAERTRDDGTFSTEDLFATLKDVGTEASFVTPGLGEIQGFRLGRELLSGPTDWLTKALGVVGVAGAPLAGVAGTAHLAGVIGLPMPARANALTPGRQSPPSPDVVPVVSRYLDPDDLSALSGVFDSPVVAGGIIPTTSDLSQQLMVALNGINNNFDEAARFAMLRAAIHGRRVDVVDGVTLPSPGGSRSVARTPSRSRSSSMVSATPS